MIFWDDDWEPGKLVTEQMDTNRNKVVEAYWAHYMRRPGAELPERPPQELIDQADAAWEARKAVIRAKALSIPCPSCHVPSGPCLRGKGKGKRPTEELHLTRVIMATQLLDKANKSETASDAGETPPAG